MSRKCIAKDQPGNCKDGEVYNEETQACETETLSGTLGICPPSLPYYNKDHMVCEKCPADKPYFYEDEQKCHAEPKETTNVQPTCATGQHYDAATKKCVNDIPVGGGSTAKCPPESPYWNKDTMRC